MRRRTHYLPLTEVAAGMILATPVQAVVSGQLRFRLPAAHALTADNLRQLAAHRVEFVFVDLPDDRSDQEVAVDAALAARRTMEIFNGADLSDPPMAALFDQILTYRSK